MALEFLERGGLERRALEERDDAKSCASIYSFFHEPDPATWAGQRGLMQNTHGSCSTGAQRMLSRAVCQWLRNDLGLQSAWKNSMTLGEFGVVGFDHPAADQFGSPSRSLVPWADYRQPRR